MEPERTVLKEFIEQGAKVRLIKFEDPIHGISHDVVCSKESGEASFFIQFRDETRARECFAMILTAESIF